MNLAIDGLVPLSRLHMIYAVTESILNTDARTHTEFYYQHVVSFSILTDLPSKDEWSLFDCTEI